MSDQNQSLMDILSEAGSLASFVEEALDDRFCEKALACKKLIGVIRLSLEQATHILESSPDSPE